MWYCIESYCQWFGMANGAFRCNILMFHHATFATGIFVRRCLWMGDTRCDRWQIGTSRRSKTRRNRRSYSSVASSHSHNLPIESQSKSILSVWCYKICAIIQWKGKIRQISHVLLTLKTGCLCVIFRIIYCYYLFCRFVRESHQLPHLRFSMTNWYLFKIWNINVWVQRLTLN